MAASPDDDDEAAFAPFAAELGFSGSLEDVGSGEVPVEGTSFAVTKLLLGNASSFGRGQLRALELLRNNLSRPKRGIAVVSLRGDEGARFFANCIPLLEADGRRWASTALPAYDWLWMIRRVALSHIWQGPERVGARSHLTAIATADNTKPGTVPQSGMIVLSKRHGRALAYLMGFVALMTELEMAYRWIGKGGTIRLDFHGKRILRDDPGDLLKELGEYDARVLAERNWGGLGVVQRDFATAVAPARTIGAGPFTLLNALSGSRWVGKPGQPGSAIERYVERYATLEEVFELFGAMPEDVLEVGRHNLGPLLALSASYAHMESAGDLSTKNVRMVGYSVHVGDLRVGEGNSRLGAALQAGIRTLSQIQPLWAPTDVDALWQGLLALKPSAIPRRSGPVVLRVARNIVVVDWYAASLRLLQGLRYPAISGAAANQRATMFEEGVRRSIAGTPCRPAPWLEALLGRHLKRAGASNAFGEIDAAATIPGSNVHLLVSCKSYPYSEAYQRGDHNAVRNVSTKLSDDIRSALDLANLLTEERFGANYEVPNDAVLVPVVVTPRHMYCNSKLANHRWFDDQHGPQLCGGVNAFLEFLNGYEQTPDDALSDGALGER